MSSSTSKREYAIDYVGKGKKSVETTGGGNVILNAGVHAIDGPEHSTGSDLTRLDATATEHGLLPKLSGDVLDLLRGDGTFGTAAAEAVTVADAGGYFAGTNVETVLQELASKDLGYQAHGALGSTETFSALTGWHSGTFSANCTATFSGATSGLVASMVLELVSDGSSVMTWPGSVVWTGGSAPTLSTTPGDVDVILFMSRDGGTTWYGFPTGGTSSGPDLSAINFLVGTASGDLSAEIVVGTTPGGELGGTWGSPTVDATHSGSTHAATQAAAEATAAAALAAHVAAGGGSSATDHLHINDVTYSGDGSTVAFELPAAPFDAYSVTAYVAGTRTEVTLSGTFLTTMTFGSAPASATDNIKVDLIAAAA